MKLQFMATCLGDNLFPNAAMSAVKILRRLGHEVAFRSAQTCCGQPMYNSGYADLARDQAKHTINVFTGDDPVIVPSGSCAAMVRVEYVHLFEDDAEWRERAKQLAERTFEFSEFLVNQLKTPDVGARFEGSVAHHYACHLRTLGLKNEVRTLVENVAGAAYKPLFRQDQCCGFGGSFAVRFSEISTSLVDDKIDCIRQSQADVVVSTDAGCIMNISGRMRREGETIPLFHIAEFLHNQIS